MNPQHEWRRRRLIALQSLVRFNLFQVKTPSGLGGDAAKLWRSLLDAGMECDLWPNWKRLASHYPLKRKESLWEW